MKENVIIDKTFKFSVEVVELYKYLTETKKEYVLSKQFLRSGTSIGANVEETAGGLSRKDFILHATEFIQDSEFQIIGNNLEEIIRILVSILNFQKLKSPPILNS